MDGAESRGCQAGIAITPQLKQARLPMHDTQLVPFALTLRPKTLSAVVHMVLAWGRDARANVIAATSPMQAVAPTMFPRLACVPQR